MKRCAGGRPRAGPRDHGPRGRGRAGGGAGPRRVQRRAAAAPEPRARRAGGAGRRLEPARQLGPPSGRLKGQAACVPAGGADTRGVRRPRAARPAASCPPPPQPLLQPPARPHCSHPSRWTPAPPSRAEPPFCREVRPGVKHLCPPVAPRRGSCREIRKLSAPGPGSDQKRLPPASLSDPTLIPLNPAPQPRSPPPPSCLGCSDLGVSTLSAGASLGLVGETRFNPTEVGKNIPGCGFQN
ncbi:basic proline-rich protein-like [Trachypithecus francoisi]|uniref:basic proline-rich protein-like n=1 Tax=Trachypithecus francoisi TaxID=54180 RepID=UPI00141B151B|nr:basic proline-rich protein-like [Trachypithecus francoisi]